MRKMRKLKKLVKKDVYDEDLDTLFVVSNIESGKDGTIVVTDEEGETYYYDPNDTLYWQANNR